jgi:hypothetical protein
MSSRDVDRSLELARQVFAPSARHRERVLAQLATRGVLGSAAAGSPGAAPARAARWLGGRWLGLCRAGLFVSAGFALGYWFAETRAPEQSAALASAPAREARAADSPGVSAPPALPSNSSAERVDGLDMAPLGPAAPNEPSVTARHATPKRAVQGQRRAHAARLPPPETETPGLESERFADELLLLQRAERAIRAGNGPLARSFIADLEARFPRTALGQERAAVLVLAACAASEPDAASAARTFITQHPNSVYLDRIRDACDLAPSPGTPPDVTGNAQHDTPSTSPGDGSPSHGH